MRLTKKVCIAVTILTFGLSATAQEDTTSTTIDAEFAIADMLDSLATQKMFATAFSRPTFNKNNKYNFAEDSVPRYDDYTYQARLAKLDAHSPFDLVYNAHVKSFIDLYTIRKRESVSRMLGMSQLYYPMFEEVLDRYNIPLELKHLAVIESALIPYARSRAGAMGLWQFMYPTGKMYNLNVTSYIDQRCDPYKATVAAAEYLKSLYTMFGDWQMVLAAYNAGPGAISKAIRRSGGKKTYWEIRPYLPRETQGYVPAFIAANYVMNYCAEHNLYPASPLKTYFEVDTVIVKEQMTFEEISQALNVSNDELLYFNPQYRKNLIPSGGHSLCLPKDKIALFLSKEQEIYAAIEEKRKENGVGLITEVKKVHTIRQGESLATIARKYGCTVADLKTWNIINKRNGAYPGRKLTVYVREQQTVKSDNVQVAASNTNKSENKQLAQNTVKSEYIYHKVKSGESFSTIAKKYGVRINDIKELNHKSSDNLQIGQILKIKPKGE